MHDSTIERRPELPSLPGRILTIWQLQRVWLISLGILVLLLVFVPSQGIESARFALGNLLTTAPYLLLSIGLAAYASATGADNLIARAFSGSPGKMIVFAALAGGLSPFCSCGVIPLIAALLTMGIPLSAVMAFWLASPIMDPSMFVLTAGVLGTEFAIAKTLAAIGIGLLGGAITQSISRAGGLAAPLRDGVGNGGCGGAKVRVAKPVAWKFWTEQPRQEKFWREGHKTAMFLAKWLTLAFILESLMLAYVPASWVSAAVGGTGLGSIAVASLVGVPAYFNGYAALPLVSGLMSQGMAGGAGMAFLVAGGVTSLPAAIAVFALVKRPAFALYIGLSLGGAFLAGLLFQLWVSF
jgi:uncharacterized protein